MTSVPSETLKQALIWKQSEVSNFVCKLAVAYKTINPWENGHIAVLALDEVQSFNFEAAGSPQVLGLPHGFEKRCIHPLAITFKQFSFVIDQIIPFSSKMLQDRGKVLLSQDFIREQEQL